MNISPFILPCSLLAFLICGSSLPAQEVDSTPDSQLETNRKRFEDFVSTGAFETKGAELGKSHQSPKWKQTGNGLADTEDGNVTIDLTPGTGPIAFNDATTSKFSVSRLKAVFESHLTRKNQLPPLPVPLGVPAYFEDVFQGRRTLIVTNGITLSAFIVVNGKAVLHWSRDVTYDKELLQFDDFSAPSLGIKNLAKTYRKERLNGEIAGSPDLALLGPFSCCACRIGPKSILVSILRKHNLSLYLIDEKGGKLIACRKIFYDFAILNLPAADAGVSFSESVRNMNPKETANGIVLAGKGDRAYVVVVHDSMHCVYSFDLTTDKTLAFIGRYKVE